MTLCNSAVTDLVALDDVSTWHQRPNEEHGSGSISIGPCAKEAHGDTNGSDLCTEGTSEPVPGNNYRTRRCRPCKGKRLRYKKFVERLIDNVMTSPHVMNVQSIDWPPSLQNDFQKQQRLMMKLAEYKLRQLKVQGEPCTVNQAQNYVIVLRMSL